MYMEIGRYDDEVLAESSQLDFTCIFPKKKTCKMTSLCTFPKIFRASVVIICSLLFIYKTIECVLRFHKNETVTKVETVQQPSYPLPKICLRCDYNKAFLHSQGISYDDYVQNGKWTGNSTMSPNEIYNSTTADRFTEVVKMIKAHVNIGALDGEGTNEVISLYNDTGGYDVRDWKKEHYCESVSHPECTCIHLSSDLTARGVYRIEIYFKKSPEITSSCQLVLIAPGNYYNDNIIRNVLYLEMNYVYRYNIVHKVDTVLGMPPEPPCDTKISFKEDDIKLRYVGQQVAAKFNCTVPWLLHFQSSDLPICGAQVGQKALNWYNDHILSLPPSFRQACTNMEVTAINSLKLHKDNNKGQQRQKEDVLITFLDTIKASHEVISYPFLSLVADLGGYLGLTLGISLLDLVKPMLLISDALAKRWKQPHLLSPIPEPIV